jgi:nucleotide-binding universal stress UspA family protein
VVGARRQGSIEATLLGSVSRAVVEHAPCSVLVARSITTRRLLLATDGSAPATFATSIVGAWPMFADARIRLVGVGEGERHFADEAAEYLAARGRQVQTEGRAGDVAMELVAAARSWPADLVVLGFSARPILHRLVLGTVARQVVDTVTSSVLVARPHRATDGE